MNKFFYIRRTRVNLRGIPGAWDHSTKYCLDKNHIGKTEVTCVYGTVFGTVKDLPSDQTSKNIPRPRSSDFTRVIFPKETLFSFIPFHFFLIFIRILIFLNILRVTSKVRFHGYKFSPTSEKSQKFQPIK